MIRVQPSSVEVKREVPNQLDAGMDDAHSFHQGRADSEAGRGLPAGASLRNPGTAAERALRAAGNEGDEPPLPSQASPSQAAMDALLELQGQAKTEVKTEVKTEDQSEASATYDRCKDEAPDSNVAPSEVFKRSVAWRTSPPNCMIQNVARSWRSL